MGSVQKSEKYSKYFNEKSFFRKIATFSGKAGTGILFYALILYFLIKDRDIPIRTRLVFIAALGYFILPTDLISDFLPGLGFTDDLSFMIYAIAQGTDHITPELKLKANSKLASLLGKKEIENIEPELETDSV